MASPACLPEQESSIVLPMPAASIIRPMIDRPETSWPLKLTRIDRIELAGGAHELGGSARVQAALVGDRQVALDRADGRVRRGVAS